MRIANRHVGLSGRGPIATAAAAFSLLIVIAGCSGGGSSNSGGSESAAAKSALPGVPASLINEANAEGHLTLYRLAYSFEAQIFPEFNKLFPKIRITSFEATTPDLMTKYSAEARAGRDVADVVMNSDVESTVKLNSEGLITHYTPTSASSLPYGADPGVYYPFAQVRLCNAYNSDLVSESQAKSLATWQGILGAQWKGKAGMVSFGTGGAQVLPYYYAYETAGPDFFNRMLAQEPILAAAVPDLVNKLESGGISVLFFANDGNLATALQQGAPVRWKCPAPALTQYTFQFIGAKAPHPAAAKLWIDFLTSKLGQKLVMQSLGLGTVRSGMQDLRPFTKDSWYVAKPSAPYTVNWAKLPAVQAKIQAAYNEATK